MVDQHPRATVLVFGAGVIGGQVCDLLARMDDRFRIVVAARNAARLNERANLTITSALCLGHQPDVVAVPCDVTQTDRCAALIAQVDPDIVVNATSVQTFWRISQLPGECHKRLEQAKIGPWLPNHLATARALMRAMRAAGSSVPVVNASFPDAVNPALATVGLAPLVGGGNIANIVPTLTRAAARQLGRERTDLDLVFVAHHVACNAISSNGSPGTAPYWLRVMDGDREVTDDLDHTALFASVTGEFRRVRGITGQIVAASGVAAVVSALARTDGDRLMHVPGPNALPGGYPARVGRGRVELALPEGLDRDDAIRVNLEGQTVEGIAEIRPDGTIVYGEPEMAVLREAFGYDCARMHVDEVDDWVGDLQARYTAYAARHGVPVEGAHA
ncbi:saccharopine dehydrogenase NADP-binding domain-containing protein [Stappia sp.]|jgi:hypothetical protein|uniref:saccharopine dehydrogenase NADP-binding domain-containing protein n=1 Tax=Stappia sp. TaxID=1870903 RepID=UPI003D0D22A9